VDYTTCWPACQVVFLELVNSGGRGSYGLAQVFIQEGKAIKREAALNVACSYDVGCVFHLLVT